MQEEGDYHTNVYVKYLPNFIEDSNLHSLFSPFGSIISAKVMIDHTTGKSRGYGFVRFTKEEEATNAIKALDGHKIGGKTLLCKVSHSFALRNPCCNLYIKPFPASFNEDELREIFEKYGPISTVRLVSDLGYENVHSAIRAIQELDGAKMFNYLPPLIVKYAESDTQKAIRHTQPQQMQQQFPQYQQYYPPLYHQIPPPTYYVTNTITTTNEFTITTTTTTTINEEQVYNTPNHLSPIIYYPPNMPTMYVPVTVPRSPFFPHNSI